ncbi:hypothetical protein [Eisenbergiella porci]|uniref:hypothetical protein n=1 Tax=Eisenbergiella porci TaxID=2652274 RepID=UPI002A7FAD62|nr:hypothetical protein [Eisenbergiella porci]
MLVAEIREILKDYQEEDLRLLIVELYKAMPKRVREDKEIDNFLKNAKERLRNKNIAKKQEKVTDVKLLKPEIETFLENAYAQNYFAPNRVIPKQERPKWRFKVKSYIKALQTVPPEGEEGNIAADLLDKLYVMLCYACRYYIFNTEDPFASVGIGQPELFDIVLKKRFSAGISRDAIKKAIALTVNSGMDRNTIHSELMMVLAVNLPTADSKLLAIEEAKAQKAELDGEINRNSGKKTVNSYSGFEKKEKANNLTELIFRLYAELCEYEDGISYYKRNIHETNKEVELYLLLELLYLYDLKDLLLREYEKGVKSRIKPRKNLTEIYQYTKVRGELPEYFW